MSQKMSIEVLAPLVKQSVDSFSETPKTEAESYTITDGIGFDVANFTIEGSLEYLDNWFTNGLLRDVTWLAPDGGIAWEGYVSKMLFTHGNETQTKTIDVMANRVLYLYKPLDTSTNPPRVGAQTPITKNDTVSQSDYGIKTAIFEGGECTAATADDQALAELTRLSYIPRGRTGTSRGGKEPSLKLELKGYAHTGNWWTYTQTTDTTTDDADNIILLVLAADPNGWLSTSDVNVDTNTLAVEKYWDGKQLGWKVVQTIAGRGREVGGEGFPWTVGVYERRRTTYKASEGVDSNGNQLTTNQHLTITHHITDKSDVYLDDAGDIVRPWQLRPDRLLFTSGVSGPPLVVRQVRFTAPDTVQYAGDDALNEARNTIKKGCEG